MNSTKIEKKRKLKRFVNSKFLTKFSPQRPKWWIRRKLEKNSWNRNFWQNFRLSDQNENSTKIGKISEFDFLDEISPYRPKLWIPQKMEIEKSNFFFCEFEFFSDLTSSLGSVYNAYKVSSNRSVVSEFWKWDTHTHRTDKRFLLLGLHFSVFLCKNTICDHLCNICLITSRLRDFGRNFRFEIGL